MLKVLMVASEANPFAKTGGLADVLGSLPGALNKQGVDARVIMPKYGTISSALRERIQHKETIYVRISWKNQFCGIEQTEYNGVTYYFIDNEYYFRREGIYGYDDEVERFAFFCRAVLEAIPHLDFIPDILHCNDWQTGMIPVLLEAQYRNRDKYENIATMFTIHNLRYQGEFSIPVFQDLFGLGDEYFTSDKLEYYGNASFLKGGLTYSHILTTVSNSYAEEIQNPFYGERMDGLLRARSHSLHGIVNGIDYDEFNPQTDPFIFLNYNQDTLEGKIKNKLALQEELNMPVNGDIPAIGLISRLVDQKGLDLIARVLDDIMGEDLQLYILGTGDYIYESMFHDAACRYPSKVSANIRFDNGLAHKIYAASDLFLMPSLFEPCGLGQLISLRYGTLPIVRETGGLRDTVLSYNENTVEGNGFSFTNYNAHDMLFTIKRALQVYKYKDVWSKLQETAITGDYSWQYSAGKYIDLYSTLKGR